MRLELQVNGELQLTGVGGATDAGGERTTADGTCAGTVNGAVRIAEIDVVEGVEGIHAELRSYPLVKRHVLEQRHIAIEEVRPKERVAAYVSDGVQTGAGETTGDGGCVA